MIKSVGGGDVVWVFLFKGRWEMIYERSNNVGKDGEG